MRKRLVDCCAMMAEMMQKRGSPEDEGKHGPAGETGQQPRDETRRTDGCGCRGSMMERMMGECFEDGRNEERRPQD